MDAFAAGQVVIIPFPFSDLSAQKFRPAVVLAAAGRGDWVLCQITSNPYADAGAVEINQHDFCEGSLQRISYARPNKLFTANDSLFASQVGTLTASRFSDLIEAVIVLLRGGGV
ncbi:MAG: type II toxin-antitoxin system PemK/MazF family toxin [Gallionella sp.]